MSVWWIRIITGLVKVNPSDVIVQSNLQDFLDVIQQMMG